MCYKLPLGPNYDQIDTFDYNRWRDAVQNLIIFLQKRTNFIFDGELREFWFGKRQLLLIWYFNIKPNPNWHRSVRARDIFDIFRHFRNSAFSTFEIWFSKKHRFFPPKKSVFFSKSFFDMIKKYFLVGIFCVTRYTCLVCKT